MDPVDPVTQVLQPLTTYIVVTFLVTDVIKHLLRSFDVYLGDRAIVVSIGVAMLLSYGWTLSVLPEATRPGFDLVAVVMTSLIIAGAASGVFGWAKKLFPWYEEISAGA